jgi:ABC-type proline/glycine betaine transport system permease subunit
MARLSEPFIEFFRYLPAPAFGALAVAVLGIYDSPKIAIIVIGTLFQQVLIVANTTRKLDPTIIEAALTLGTSRLRLLTKVVVPGIMPDLFRDQRILLGWAWTYLIVAELIGTSSGITWFITTARYQHFDAVYAAIMMIGIIGFGTDILLGRLGRRLFRGIRSHERIIMIEPKQQYRLLHNLDAVHRRLTIWQREKILKSKNWEKITLHQGEVEARDINSSTPRNHLCGGPFRLRQVHPGQNILAGLEPHVGEVARRQADHRAGTGPRHGVPGLFAVPLADGQEERHVRPAHERRGTRPGRTRRPTLAGTGRPAEIRRRLSASALRRHAPARRHRPRPGQPAAHPADGRPSARWMRRPASRCRRICWISGATWISPSCSSRTIWTRPFFWPTASWC